MRSSRFLAVLWFLLGGVLLAAAAPPAIVAGPYLTGLGPDRVTVSWETDRPATGRVEYAVQSDKAKVKDAGPATSLHHVTLTGLPPATACTYQVHIGDQAAGVHKFTTAPAGPAPFRFAAYGDSRGGPARHRRIAQAILKHEPAFVVHTGDFVTSGIVEALWVPEFFAPARELLAVCPVVTAIGNHDTSSPAYYDYFLSSRTESWFHWRYGDADFFVLNTCAAMTADGPQRQWLAQALESSKARWKIAVFHHPLYSSGFHGGADAPRAVLLPLLLKHGVDLILAGHDHIYERTRAAGSGPNPSDNALVEIITGGGGAPIYPVAPGPWTVKAASKLNFCIFDMKGDELAGTAYDEKDEPIDQFALAKRDGRKSFGDAIGVEAIEVLTRARIFGTFRFPHVWRKYHTRRFKFTIRNPYPGEIRGELTWEIRNKAWSVDPPSQALRIPPGGEAEVAFIASFETPPEGPVADPVPVAVLSSGGLRVAVPGFVVERPPLPRPGGTPREEK